MRPWRSRQPPDGPSGPIWASDLHAASSRFAELWDTGAVGTHQATRKTIRHPDVGLVTVDCDVLTVQGSDLRIVAYTAPPGSDAAEKLKLLAVIGTQVLG
jgi:MmyB-like transcription regulator ligand binding domain